jgi:hypothetical protein
MPRSVKNFANVPMRDAMLCFKDELNWHPTQIDPADVRRFVCEFNAPSSPHTRRSNSGRNYPMPLVA